MKRTTIELPEEQYFYLKEKALGLQKQNKSATVVSIIRELIDKDCREQGMLRRPLAGRFTDDD